MQVELLVVPECPNEVAARLLLNDAAIAAGIKDLQLAVTVIDTDQEACRRGFVGSPTFLVAGVDPFAITGSAIGLSCRVYAGPNGPAGVPDMTALRDALLKACAAPTSATGDR